MVLGNHALQRGYDPAALNDWFTTSFVDGFPWVMPVNVVGMSQHAERLRGNHRMSRPPQGLQRLTDLDEVRAREPHRDVFQPREACDDSSLQ
jgi:deoxyribodipyrimidine photolyase-like uncharacterized protein